MKHIARREILRNDKLVIRVRDKSNGKIISQGKRTGKDCPLTRDEIRAYVELGPVAAVLAISEGRNIPRGRALDLLCQARDYPFASR